MTGWRIVVGGAIGAVLGLLIGAAIYVPLSGWLEGQTGPLREAQGLAWNLVPLLTLVGGAIGAVGVWSRGRR